MNSNITNTNNYKSTKELKDQVMNDLKKVKEDFEEIKQRMTPGQIIDDALFYRRGDKSPTATFEHLKSNPVGTSFLTIGTLLLMQDENSLSYESMMRSKVERVTDSVSNVYHEAKTKIDKIMPHKELSEGQVPNVGDVTKEKVSAATDTIKEKAQTGMQSVKTGLHNVAQNAKTTLKEAKASAKETIQSATETVKEKSLEAYDTVTHLDPMTYFALGAGLGALTGAAIPLSEKETQMVDQYFGEGISDLRQEIQDALNQSVNILKNEFIGDVSHINLNFF